MQQCQLRRVALRDELAGIIDDHPAAVVLDAERVQLCRLQRHRRRALDGVDVELGDGHARHDRQIRRRMMDPAGPNPAAPPW
jgi:hypothetical protein